MTETQDIYDSLSEVINGIAEGSRGYRIQLEEKIWQYYDRERYGPAIFVAEAGDYTLRVCEGYEIVQVESTGIEIYREYRVPGLAAELTRVKYATLSINEFESEYKVLHKDVIEAVKNYFNFKSTLEIPNGFRIWPDEVDDLLNRIAQRELIDDL